eukprot:CAMPEP_0201493506 /NCGR_PEP_ID=MMETSP0151_2-20130828/39059_1 /ASSEMBLY_ACC=CAM_ASM_000257 /TAXON_ID=200890 /ORGANISM="Paramoeba atlantica, Strain 621/1 / CCAP 1560/9" /LENGTH=587 /DNA_ID=CAMNT_0047880977 /DNA_START=67 /DNA_END=1830 /DNA_ORIENTATION=+
MDFVYGLMKWLCRVVLGIFFQEVEIVGAENIPKDGPVIFTGNHQNQFVDGIMLLSYTSRQLGFLIAKKSYDKPMIGHFAKLVGAIPVIRKDDVAFVGKGKVIFEIRGEGEEEKVCYVKGIGTKFTEELTPRASFSVKGFKGQPVVRSIESDELAIVNSFLELPEPQAFKILPHLDQNEVFTTVHDTLRDEKCICIFPEGGSHDRTTLLPLKAGVAIMALGALEKYGVSTTIIPCGLTYFSGHRFRSRVMLEFGSPLVVTPDMLEKYRANKRETSGSLLKRVEEGLKDVTVNVPDYETLRCLRTARRLYQPYGLSLPANQYLELNRRLAAGFERWKNEPQMQRAYEDILAYHQNLDDVGLKDVQLQTLDMSTGIPLFLMIQRICLIVVLSLLALPGFLLFSPAMIYIRQRALHESRKAKAASSVKIEGKDVIASQKILIGIMSIPLLYFFYFGLTTFFFGTYFGILFLVFYPILGYITTKIAEHLVLFLHATKPLLLLFTLPVYRRKCHELIEERRLLQKKVRAIIEIYGPKTFGEEWKTERVIKREELIEDGITSGSATLWPRRESFKHQDVSSNKAILQGLDAEFN